MVTIRRAGPPDITAFMEIERQPGFEHLVGRSSAEFHARVIDDTDYAYLAGLTDDGAIAGIAILRDLENPQGNILLKRLAVLTPGSGFGKPFLREVIGWVFTNTPAHRLWLDHIITNDRARHVYEQSGFVREGVFRQAYELPDGSRTDLAVMSILRPEWLARQR
ncbi:GNAT family N-acetyltransferase [Rhizobium sp. KVB221]|uniref:GNAT family N-acetyltransferase n=1 Tax=Rhizobium setariae TaxID=2801340 RepID=A0A936YQ30_9HYPH|nr:GNAT family protein [Rhizobium setariae]MBL0370711.1 GNAT family N-acetyltransferase [Rhizobium setariae]